MEKPNKLSLTKIVFSVSLVVCLILLVNYIPKIFLKKITTILPIDFEYKEVLITQGIMIKDEKVYSSESKGELYRIADEGYRVPVGIKVAEVISSKDMTFYKSELDSIESLINHIDANPSKYNDVNIIEGSLVQQIQQNIQNKTFNNLNNLKENLLYSFNSETQILETNTNNNFSKEQLIDKRSKLQQEISKYNEGLYSRHSGILSYKIDSFENKLKTTDLDSAIDFIFDFGVKNIVDNGNDNTGIFKIIDGYDYFIAFRLTGEETKLIEDKDKLEIEIIRLNDEKIKIDIPIIEKYSRGTEEIIIVKSNLFLEKIYDERILDVEIVASKYESYKIPLESILKIQEREGVFIRSFYDVVEFRPILINAKDDKFAYVNKGNTDNKIIIEDKSYKTINEFSEIIKIPNEVVEGQILN